MIGTLQNVEELLKKPHPLMISGSKENLEKIPPGNWIGGTVPFIVNQKGERVSDDLVEITRIPAGVCKASLRIYNLDNIHQIHHDGFDQGISFMIIPAESVIHHSFSMNSPDYPAKEKNNLLGWVSGYNLDQENQAWVVFGPRKEFLNDHGVAIHYQLRQGYSSLIEKQNRFEPDQGPVLSFPKSGFSTDSIMVEDQSYSVEDFFENFPVDQRFPLIHIEEEFKNISVKEIKDGVLSFYAPVFKNQKYRWGCLAKSENQRPLQVKNPMFSCNCILNQSEQFLQNLPEEIVPGPVTFGEIAENLLNQTSVQLTIRKDQNLS